MVKSWEVYAIKNLRSISISTSFLLKIRHPITMVIVGCSNLLFGSNHYREFISCYNWELDFYFVLIERVRVDHYE